MKSDSKLEMIAVGHLCMDSILVVEDYPEQNSACRVQQLSTQPGGSASQAAAAFARLGGKVGYIGMVGDDYQGSFLHGSLLAEGIDCKHLTIVSGGSSSSSVVIINRKNASRTLFSHHDQLPLIDFSSESLLDYMSGASVLHIDGTNYYNALHAARAARQMNLTVSMDGCSLRGKTIEQTLELVKLADILIMNEIFPMTVMKMENRDEALLEIAQYGVGIVISTCGSQGCFVVCDGKVKHFPAFEVPAVDTTGAGDSFHGAFIHAWLRGISLEESIKFASAAAAVNCLTIGGRDGLPVMDTVLDFITNNQESWLNKVTSICY